MQSYIQFRQKTSTESWGVQQNINTKRYQVKVDFLYKYIVNTRRWLVHGNIKTKRYQVQTDNKLKKITNSSS